MTLLLTKEQKQLSQSQLETSKRIVEANKLAAAKILLALQKETQTPVTTTRKITCLI